jgi:EpsI family protein
MSEMQKSLPAGVANIPRRAWLIGLASTAAAIAGTTLKPAQMLADTLPEVDLEAMIPTRFGEWQLMEKGSVVAVDPGAQRTLESTYDQILARTYQNASGAEILLSIAYGRAQTHELKAHRQEVCYRAQGFDIRFVHPEKAVIKNHAVPITRMHAVRPERSEMVTYWFTMGDRVVYSMFERLFTGLRYGVEDKVPDGFLVRVSNIADDSVKAFATQDEFSKALLDAVDPGTRTRLSGI